MIQHNQGRTRVTLMTPPSSSSPVAAPRRILITRAAADCADLAALMLPPDTQVDYMAPFDVRPVGLAAEVVDAIVAAADTTTTALVFTSPRALAALTTQAPQIITAWRQKTVFVVGAATAAACAAAGFSHVDAAAGDGDALVARLALVAGERGIDHIIHLSGDVIAVDLAEKLTGTLTVSRHVVYQAHLQPLAADLVAALQAGQITDIVLFSARVAAHLAAYLRAGSASPRLYCLSNRVAAAAQSAFSPLTPLVTVAPQPTIAALLTLAVLPPAPV